ncbi:hypothetical protein CPC08DRAFT_257586 [Agrocybe pediades]|nr:hypothetical protein CPC08DRAFT_257586 [Agrocybe pediades]
MMSLKSYAGAGTDRTDPFCMYLRFQGIVSLGVLNILQMVYSMPSSCNMTLLRSEVHDTDGTPSMSCRGRPDVVKFLARTGCRLTADITTT